MGFKDIKYDVPVCQIHYIYITFTLHLHYIYITFTLHLHYIYITFTLHLHYIYTTFTLHLHYINTTLTLHSHYIHTTFTLHSHYIHIIFTYWRSVQSFFRTPFFLFNLVIWNGKQKCCFRAHWSHISDDSKKDSKVVILKFW